MTEVGTRIPPWRRTTGALVALIAGASPAVAQITFPPPSSHGPPALAAPSLGIPPVQVPPAFHFRSAPPPARAQPWPYNSFGPPGAVVSRREIRELAATQLRFANGVRLNVKPTDFAKDEILVRVRFGRGFQGRPAGQPAGTWLLRAFVVGGTREMSYPTLRASLGPTPADPQLTVSDTAFQLTAKTDGADFTRELQLMTALIDRPGYRPEALAILKGLLGKALATAVVPPPTEDLPVLLHGGDARWSSMPTAEAVAAAGPGDLKAMLDQDLHSGDLEVTVVGDITVERAIAAVAATFGALPSRQPAPPAGAPPAIRPPTGGAPTTLAKKGRIDQAVIYVEWPTNGFRENPHRFRVFELADAVLQSRLAARLHARDVTLGPLITGDAQASELPGFGYADIGVIAPPWKAAAVFDTLFDTVGELCRTPPGREEIDRVLKPHLAAYQERRNTNGFWVAALAGSQVDPEFFLVGARDATADQRAVTGEEISQVCRQSLRPEQAWRLLSRAADAPTPVTAATAAPATTIRRGAWAQTYSDLAADPTVRFGTLANGMRYAIKHNGTPTGETSIRFRIGAGSLEEREDQRGLAHFLEHMAFKGSTHVARDDMLRILERHGLAFGPDINAFTQLDQTYFALDLPQSGPEYLATGLMLMREIASELRLSQSAMDAERGVILAEERQDESPTREAQKQEQAFYLDGQLAARRETIGLVDVIEHAPVSRIRAFYDAYYRPENATLIVVGDVDPDNVEAAIKARFGDWRGRGPAGPFPDLGSPDARGETVEVIAKPGLAQALSVGWLRPFDSRADTYVAERDHVTLGLGVDVLNRRLNRLAAGADAPFLSASVTTGDFAKSADAIWLGALPAVGGFEPSLAAVVREQRRIAAFDVDADEFEEALKVQRNNIEAGIGNAPTALSASIADGYVAAVNGDKVIMAPAQVLAQFDADVAGLTPAAIRAALAAAFTGRGPLILVTSPTPPAGGASAIQALYDADTARQTLAGDAQAKTAWPYSTFGTSGKVVWRRETPELGLTQVRFANGVRLNVKPTAFGKNRIQVTARIGDGLIGLPPNHPAVNWLAGALLQGGTRELSVNELQNALWNVGASATTSFLDDALNISGVTGPHDFPRQMELLAALISRPGYRPEALEHAKDLMAVALKTADYTPGEVLTVNLPVLLHGGDRRWAVLPTAEELAASKPGDMAAVLDGALKSGAIEVTVVGDVTVDRALYEAGRTLGALPMRPDPAPVPASSPTVRPPAGGGPALVLRHKGRADQAIAYVEWPTTDFYANTHQARTLVLASAILQNRLIDRVRLTEGATYAPNADATSVSELLGFGYVQATVEIPPPRVAGFYRDIEAIVADLGRTPPTADEMLRARAPLLDSEAKARQDLDFWSYYLAHSQADPRELTSIQTKIGDYNSITAAEISAVCRKYLTPDRAWKLIILPAAPGGP